MDRAELIDEADPQTFFGNPKNERTTLFLGQVLGY